jgi:hypothetical protein
MSPTDDANRRGCYCGLWDTDPQFLEGQGIPRGYCGLCQTCGRPGHDYLGFLKAGCSKFPLEILRDAGVDMSQPGPVDTALNYFERLVNELDELL